MPFFMNRGLQLHYLDEGTGSPVLLLHAFPLNSAAFSPQLAELSRRYRMIVPDLSGFGLSEAKSVATEMTSFADDALALLDKLQLERVPILGVSMGGYICMAILRKASRRASAVILCDTHPSADDPEATARREENAQKTLQEGMSFLAQTMIGKLLSTSASTKIRDQVARLILSNSKDGAAAALRGMALRLDSADVLAQYSGPAMVMVGEQDLLTPPEKAVAMAALLPTSRLFQIPNAGHLANMENAPPFNRELDSFLSQRVRTT